MPLGADATVVIAGGGTGGHLIPGLAVARELVGRGVRRIVFVGTERGVETQLVPAAGFDLELIAVGGLKNVGWRSAGRTMLNLPRAVRRSKDILRTSGAAAVLGIGGYASGPVLLAAAWLRLPITVLESNARTGLANRLAAHWVQTAAVTFPETARDFRRAVVTGVPVRDEFFHLPPPPRRSPPVLLAFGGSQGARAINDALLGAARIWNAKGWGVHLIHQTGAREYNRVHDEYCQANLAVAPPQADANAAPGGGFRVEVHPFIEDMAGAMARADIVISRAGASTLAELAAAGRAAVLIPFPGAADDHQLRNAQAYEQSGAAWLLEQRELTGERLAAMIEELGSAPAQLARVETCVRRWARPGAAAAIADLVLQRPSTPTPPAAGAATGSAPGTREAAAGPTPGRAAGWERWRRGDGAALRSGGEPLRLDCLQVAAARSHRT